MAGNKWQSETLFLRIFDLRSLIVVTFSIDTYPVRDCLFVCFVALRPKSTATVMAGRSVHLTTLFPGQA